MDGEAWDSCVQVLQHAQRSKPPARHAVSSLCEAKAEPRLCCALQLSPLCALHLHTELCEARALCCARPQLTPALCCALQPSPLCCMRLPTELCEGGNLVDALALSSSYCERDAARIMRQLLDAVAHIHAHDIVHMDIKVGGLSHLSVA